MVIIFNDTNNQTAQSFGKHDYSKSNKKVIFTWSDCNKHADMNLKMSENSWNYYFQFYCFRNLVWDSANLIVKLHPLLEVHNRAKPLFVFQLWIL